MNPLEHALQQAKIHLMTRPDTVFFTTVCFSMKLVWDTTCPTGATDGKRLFLNPEYFMKLNQEERIFLLLHETLHTAFMHMTRIQGRDPRKWNLAADHVINLMLIARGYRMPKGGLANPDYSELSVEQIYALISDEDVANYTMDLREAEESLDELQKDIEDSLVRAQLQVQMDGRPCNIPGEIQIFLDSLLKPKLPWKKVLARYIQSFTKSDYTYRKPSRRCSSDYILPSLYSESCNSIAVAVDTSGSVTDDEFKQFISELHSILRMLKPEKLTLISFDTTVHEVVEVKTVKELSKVHFTGRGGTLIGPVNHWIEEHKPRLTLVFTDGCFHFYSQASPGNVLWLIHNNPKFSAPYGKTIHYQM